MNVLLTSVGRRAYMVKYFKEVVGENGQVHVCNSDDLTVAFQYADYSFISPLIYDNEYIPTLVKYCMKNNIEILVSLFDIDLPILAKNKKAFENVGTKVIVSDAELVEICNDKWKTYRFLTDNGFKTPRTYLTLQSLMFALDTGEVHYPIMIKPRFGCGSIALSEAENQKELIYCYEKNMRVINETYLKYESRFETEKMVYQEKLVGQEYGVDVINDLAGDFCNAIVKKKLAMRAGETDIAEIVRLDVIYGVAKNLGKITGHIANMDCDFFLVDNVPYILEMNARFGGGYPFSHLGGCNLPKALVKWVKGDDVPVDMLSAHRYIRAYKEIFLTSDDLPKKSG